MLFFYLPNKNIKGEYSDFSYLNRIVKYAILTQAQINKNNSDIEHA